MKKFEDWIIFENENVWVINKPAFVPSIPERGKITNISVWEHAVQRNVEATLCHRLDRETSGCLIIAKNSESYRNISIQFEKRKVKKIYHAVVNGNVQFTNLEVNLPINTDDLHHIKIDKQNGKAAKTIFNTLHFFKHFTLLECMPVTGRLHQIRVHLYSQRASIAGDVLYKGRKPFLSDLKKNYKGNEDEENKPMISRFALHAKSIEFEDLDGKTITAEAPYPKDFAVFLKLLNKYDAMDSMV